MKALFEESFEKDLKAVRDKKIRNNISKIIEEIRAANSTHEIKAISKLQGYKSYYRIRIRDYRIGIEIIDENVIFVRILHRKDIYRYFP